MMNIHISVMLEEVLNFLNVKPGEKYIDATLGGGGYTEAILKKGGEVLALDYDQEAIEIARRRLSACPGIFKIVHSNFSNLKQVAQENGFTSVSGIVFDLGFASFQMDNPDRGLSILKDGPLDMRLDQNLGVTAADLLNSLPERELYELFKTIGQEKHSRSIAKRVVTTRVGKPFANTKDLRELIESVYWKENVKQHIHPATRVFMALRIAVNTELENLKSVLPQATDLLRKEGRLVVVSFHSGEDAIVKRFLNQEENLKVLTDKPLKPTEEEIEKNPRSRSALLRAAEKII